MNADDIEKGLQILRRGELPSCPRNLETNVLRRVRLSRSEEAVDVWSWIASLVPKTGFVATAMAIVVVTSSMVAFASARVHPEGDIRQVQLSEALGFDMMKPAELVVMRSDR